MSKVIKALLLGCISTLASPAMAQQNQAVAQEPGVQAASEESVVSKATRVVRTI